MMYFNQVLIYEFPDFTWIIYFPWFTMLALDPEQVGPALHRLSSNLPKPQAIIVMSAHWESQNY